MFIATVPNRNSPPAILLRESYRELGKVKSRTLANLSKLPPHAIEALRALLKGASLAGPLNDAFDIVRSLPHGHVAAVLGTLRNLALHRLIDPKHSRQRDLCEALIVNRLIQTKPSSKLSTSRALRNMTSQSTLGQVLNLQSTDEDQLYAAMDWLLKRQPSIEKALAKQHLCDGDLVLYDLTSTYFEGHTCPLAHRGHSRDNQHGSLQIVFGLLTNHEGCPVAVEVFEGNTADPKTVASQIEKLRTRFGLKRVVLVGDRGMLTAARIREDLAPVDGLSWITALRNPAIRTLVQGGALQLSLFDQKDLAEITSPDYPGERLIVCKNPLLSEQRARKRNELLAATETLLSKVHAATLRPTRPLRGKENIRLRIGKVVNRYKVGKHFDIEVTDDGFTFRRHAERIAREAALDGFYVIRTSLKPEDLGAEDVVRSYKSLSRVERAFRCIKTVDLAVRPIHHHLPDRVRAHVLICMLSYYVEWHMCRALAPLLFVDEARVEAEKTRSSVVSPAPRSEQAKAKDRTKRTEDGFEVQSFRDLLRDLSTVVKDRVQPKGANEASFDKVTMPTRLQNRAFELLHVSPHQL
jgi:transposase